MEKKVILSLRKAIILKLIKLKSFNEYKNNKYYIENISVDKICKIAGTPTYIYSYNKIKENILNFKRQFNSIDPFDLFFSQIK